jgi:hypothetical protein
MPLLEMLFLGTCKANPIRLPLKGILEHFATIQRAVASTELVEPSDLVSFIVNRSFLYACNSYKAIGVLLPESYYESGTAVLHQLWAVSLNLHWIEIDAARRAYEFSSATMMEHRKLSVQMKSFELLDSAGENTDEYRSGPKSRDSHGGKKPQSCFAALHMHDRAAELGNPWEKELELIYNLTSMHAYVSPGSLLNSMFQQQLHHSDISEQNSAALIAILGIKFMVRDVELMARMGFISKIDHISAANNDFKTFIQSGRSVNGSNGARAGKKF